METLCQEASADALEKAASLISAGELVAFPTETVYGLGANALDAKAVSKIFEAKQRPQDNPLIVHIAHPKDAASLCHVPPIASRLMASFFPGALTLLMRKRPIVPSTTTAGLDTVGIRMPAHPVARKLIELAGVPIAAPSANRSGKPSPTTAAHVWNDMQGRIPMILDGGECQIGLESTVLDITQEPPMVLRPGGVTREMLSNVLGDVAVSPSLMRPLAIGEKALSPGMRYKHYSPEGALTLIEGTPTATLTALQKCYDSAVMDGHKACILAFDDFLPALGSRKVYSLGSRQHLSQMASRLFMLLRQMDDECIDYIYSPVIPTDGLGLAVMNRLGRAAGFHFIQAEEVV